MKENPPSNKGESLSPWIKIFDISAKISAKYRISTTTEAKSVMEIRLREKSLKNRKFHRYFADISVSDRNFGEWNTRARG